MKPYWHFSTQISHSFEEQLLTNRKQRKEDFCDSIDSLPLGNEFTNADLALQLIQDALKLKKNIMIFGHDDTDGVTSTYIMYHFLHDIIGHCNTFSYLPNRHIENHGIQKNTIDFARSNKIDLFITVDGGISSNEGVLQLKKMGCKVIITDHHMIPDLLPDADIIIDPQFADCTFPDKRLAGVGVSFFLVKALAHELAIPFPLPYYLWMAIGSITDRMSLTGVNHTIIKEVIQKLPIYIDDSFSILVQDQNFPKTEEGNFQLLIEIGKLLNNGRDLHGQHLSLNLLTSAIEKKQVYYQQIYSQYKDFSESMNKAFQYMDEQCLIPALQQKTGDNLHLVYDHKKQLIGLIFIDQAKAIPYPIIGACSSWLTGKLNVPIFYLQPKDEQICVCEARCQDNFNLPLCFKALSSHLLQFGGHKRAAGFAMQNSQLDSFVTELLSYLQQNATPLTVQEEIFYPEAIIPADNVMNAIHTTLSMMHPFGQDNPEPIFIISNYTQQALPFVNQDTIPNDLSPLTLLVRWISQSRLLVLDWDTI